MKWINGETWESERTRLENWHKWFAWYPVTVATVLMPDGKTRKLKSWLITVLRKGTFHSWIEDCYWDWEYKEQTE
jgi:hypothetical protein